MQVLYVRFYHASDEADLFDGSGAVAQRYGVRKLPEEYLAIVQVAEDVLSFFQVGNRLGRAKGSGRFGDLQNVAQLFDRDPRGVGSMGEIHAGGVPNGIDGALRPFAEDGSQLLLPTAARPRPPARAPPPARYGLTHQL